MINPKIGHALSEFKVGDRVKIIKKSVGDSLNYYEKFWGEKRKGKIEEIRGDGNGADINNCLIVNESFFAPQDLVLIKNSKEEKPSKPPVRTWTVNTEVKSSDGIVVTKDSIVFPPLLYAGTPEKWHRNQLAIRSALETHKKHFGK